MRALLVADLKGNAERLRWLEAQASQFDLVAIAGNFLDVFSSIPLKSQVAHAKSFLQTLRQKTCVAFCSGNHDTIDEITSSPRGPVPTWIAQLDFEPKLVADGQTRIVKTRLLVTTLSFIATVDQKRRSLESGATAQEKCGLPWLVLHHIPLHSDQIMAYDATVSEQLVRDFRPTIWFTGSSQDSTESRGVKWVEQIDETSVIHTGHPIERDYLSHIILDLEKGRLSRFTSAEKPPEVAILRGRQGQKPYSGWHSALIADPDAIHFAS
jgi:hypothetical protein